MRVTLVDDTIPFDGDTPSTHPLGGVEKAFAGLPGALARCGHEVQVFNRCTKPATIEGARWEGWEAPRPAETDVLIAYRKPSLLDFVPTARQRVLWLVGAGEYLAKSRNRARLEMHKPHLVFLGRTHLESWENENHIQATIIAPGVARAFLTEERGSPDSPAHAIVTTNPLHGLDWLLDLWLEKIRPISPTLELHVYSAALFNARQGGQVADAYRSILERVESAADAGVGVKQPLPDADMAQAYLTARVHLYPGNRGEVYCYTLAESQSCGLPAVARPLGATREGVVHGATGYVFAEDDAFANAALRLLNNDKTFQQFSNAALAMQRGRDWDEVAAEFEAIWA